MRNSYSLVLLLLCCLKWNTQCFAQQPITSTSVVDQPLFTSADTVNVVHELFQVKRKSSPLFLAATPVVLGLTIALAKAAAVGQVSRSAFGQPSASSDAALPTLGLIAGAVGFGALLERYTRYTEKSENKILRQYERTHVLPRWLIQQLAQVGKPKG